MAHSEAKSNRLLGFRFDNQKAIGYCFHGNLRHPFRSGSLGLTGLFIALVEAKWGAYGLELESPRDNAKLGSQVSFSHPKSYEIMQALFARGVIGDFRAPATIRFGFTPLYVSYADVWHVVAVLEETPRTEAWRDTRLPSAPQ